MSPRAGQAIHRRAGGRSLGTSAVTAVGLCGHTWRIPYSRARDLQSRVRQRVACPTCNRTIGVTFDYADRVCEAPGCTTRLSRYNPGPTCFAHDQAAQPAKAAAA